MRLVKSMIVTVLMVLVSSVCFAQTMSDAEYNQQKQQAMGLYNDGKFIESYDLLMTLFREKPDDKSLYVAIGRAAYGAKRYNQAIMGYEKAIANNPNSSLLYIELAAVYNSLKDYNKAKSLLMTAKEKGAGDRVDIDSYIASVDNSLETTFFSGMVGLGVGYDTNVNYGVIAKDIVLGGLPLTVSGASLPKASPTFTASSFLNLVEKFDPNNNSAMFIADLGVYSKFFSNKEVTQNNFLWVGLSAGARLAFTKFYVDILAKGNYTTYDFMSSVYGYGVEARLNASLPFGLFSRTTVNFEGKTYETSSDSDGFTFDISERLNYTIYDKGFATLELGYSLKDAKIERLTYNEFGASLSYTQTLPYSVFVEPSVSADYSLYKAPATVLETDNRNDVLVSVGVSATWHFMKGFSAIANYSYDHNISNSPIYDYDQHVISAAVNYYF